MIGLLRKRYSVRKYTNQPIPAEKIDILKESLLRSPTSRNFRPWRFVFVDDKFLLAELSKSKMSGSGLIKGAALAVVVCGDEAISDIWVEDCAIASVLLQMSAQSIGLGSCWVQIRNRHTAQGENSEEYVKRILGVPQHLRVESIIAIGCPAEKKEPAKLENLPTDRFHNNGW